jgi:glucose/arabinose dehydrogenase
MPGWPGRTAAVAAALLVAACATGPTPTQQTTQSAGADAGVSAPGLVASTVVVPDGMAAAPFDTPRQALIPAGWTMSVFARIPKARLAAWTPDGRLLVSLPAAGEVVSVGADGTPATLLANLEQPHGLAFADGRLYLAESNQVVSYAYAGGAVTDRRLVAGGLPDAKSPDLRGAYSHALKSVAVGPDGAVYFSVGSTGNISEQDRDATPPRAVIMRVPPGGGPAEPFSTGVRNGTGLAIAPDGSVWTAVNNRDNAARPSDGEVDPGYVNDHPPESIARLTPGRELGWPYCNPDGDPPLALINDVQTNPAGNRLDCAGLPPVEQSLGAHSAPLGLSFGTLPEPYGSGALVGVHGSWNRTPPRAPQVAFFGWRDGTLQNPQTLVGGFQDADGNRWGRPVAAVTGPDGAVYITDDDAGAVYRLAPPAR